MLKSPLTAKAEGLLQFQESLGRYNGEVDVAGRKKWFRVLAVDPFSSMRVNVDRLVNGPPNPITELFGHSVVNAPYTGRLVNLIGPIRGDALLRKVNEQFLIRVIDLLVMQVAEYPWIRRMVAEQLQLDAFQGVRVGAAEKGRAIVPPAFVQEVGGVAWQQREVGQLKRQGVSLLSARSVATELSRVGGSAQIVQRPSEGVRQVVMLREVSGPDQAEAMRLLSQLGAGGGTRRATGV